MDLRDTMTQTIRERRGALAVTVASRQRAPMRSRNYLLHIDNAIVSHLSFNQPHVSFRDRASSLNRTRAYDNITLGSTPSLMADRCAFVPPDQFFPILFFDFPRLLKYYL